MNRPHSPIITRIKLLHGRKSGLQIWNIRGNAIAPASGKALMLVVVKESLIREPLSNSSTRKTLLGVAAADVVAVEVVWALCLCVCVCVYVLCVCWHPRELRPFSILPSLILQKNFL